MTSTKRVKLAVTKSMDFACTLVAVAALWLVGFGFLLVGLWCVLVGAVALMSCAEFSVDVTSLAVLGVTAAVVAMYFAGICCCCGIRVFKKTGSLIKSQTALDTIYQDLTARDGLLRGASCPATVYQQELLRSAAETIIHEDQLLRGSHG